MKSLPMGRKAALLVTAAVIFSGAYAVTQTSPTAKTPAPPSTQNAPANASPAHGESGEDETAQFKQSASVRLVSKITGLSLDHAYWLAVVLNFAIVAGVIVWASKKNLPAMFRNRSASIQKSLEDARKASDDANRRISEIELRLARLDDEIGQMRTTSEKEAAAEEERARMAAAEEVRRVVESAEQEIVAAAKAARRELTAYAADLAVSLASRQIRVDTATDEKLVRRFAQQLSSDGGPGRKV